MRWPQKITQGSTFYSYRNMARLSPLLRLLGLVTACVAHVAPVSSQSTIPPSCSSNIYCAGPLLHAVQTAKIFDDSKHFVDLRLLKSEKEILQDYQELVQNNSDVTFDQLKNFVAEHFADGKELLDWIPTDFVEDPPMLNKIRDPMFKKFAKDLISIWPNLAKKIRPEVEENPDRYSLIPIPNGFIIPGGRFKEIYYWDSFWIIEGIILSGMTDTARGMIENFLFLVKKLGHVPNGSRVYYNERSQPPLLTAMANKYVTATQDIKWLSNNIDILETELDYWLANKIVDVVKDRQKYTMLRYFAPSKGPRPESYNEDYKLAADLESDERRQELYTDIKSAAESGWDFSARWFVNSDLSNSGNLSNIKTRRIIPVDLNSMYAAAAETLGNLFNMLSNTRSAKKWWKISMQWRRAIDEVLWNDEDGIWYDYDFESGEQRKYFYPTNIAPLWAKCVDESNVLVYSPKVINYLKKNPALGLPGGVPTSLDQTGEQWDFPNAWPPLQSMMIQALVNTNTVEGKEMAKELAQVWVRANYKGFKEKQEMYEKYNALRPGEVGGGGEYITQSGFGWTNGVILELLNQFGDVIQSEDSLNDI